MLKLLISPLLVAILVFAATGYAAVTTEAEYLFGDDGVGVGDRPLDSSGNGWDIINTTGGATVSSTGGPLNDAYYSFNGAGGFWKDAYDPPENNVGVEAWVRTSNLTQANRGVFGTGSSANGLALIYNSATDSWSGALGNVAWVGKLGAENYTAGDWIHLALVRDDGAATFYVNGFVVGAGSAAIPVATSGAIHIGVSDGGYVKYDGDIAYGRIFTFTAGEFEVADLNTIPEPATIALLRIGSLGMIRRRRRR